MKLKDLIDQCNGDERIQVSWDDNNWNDFDDCNVFSPALNAFINNDISCLAAVGEDIFRISMKSEVEK